MRVHHIQHTHNTHITHLQHTYNTHTSCVDLLLSDPVYLGGLRTRALYGHVCDAAHSMIHVLQLIATNNKKECAQSRDEGLGMPNMCYLSLL